MKNKIYTEEMLEEAIDVFSNMSKEEWRKFEMNRDKKKENIRTQFNRKIDFTNDRNLNMLMDFYELTMSNGYLAKNCENTIAYFDMFFRKVPDNGGFVVVAGLEQFIEYIESLRFSEDDISFLRSKNVFSEEFLSYLSNFKFSGNVYAVPEGTVMFPNEPIVTVEAPVIEAQLIETLLLLTINHQSLIATKACRIVKSANGREIIEMGARRSQGYDGAVYGARACYIGGIKNTATTLAEKSFGINACGTMAHSWIQFFDNEYEAFKTYAELYPDNCSLLIDTYDVINSGLPNAIRVNNEVLKPLGKELKAIRLDSGDIAYLSKKCRKELDKAGIKNCKIVASNSLDEYIIEDLLQQDAKVDVFGVGERLITSKSNPVFGGVYKLVAVKNKDGKIISKIKISENTEKISNPGFKSLYRFADKETGIFLGDVIALHDEKIDSKKPYTMFDPINTWKKKTLKNFKVKNIQEVIYINGKLVYKNPPLSRIQEYTKEQLRCLPEEIKRFVNPHIYHVDLSKDLYDLKLNLINKCKKEK